jgi:hypothetical protein
VSGTQPPDIRNERISLTATYLNTAAGSSLAIGADPGGGSVLLQRRSGRSALVVDRSQRRGVVHHLGATFAGTLDP